MRIVVKKSVNLKKNKQTNMQGNKNKREREGGRDRKRD